MGKNPVKYTYKLYIFRCPYCNFYSFALLQNDYRSTEVRTGEMKRTCGITQSWNTNSVEGTERRALEVEWLLKEGVKSIRLEIEGADPTLS